MNLGEPVRHRQARDRGFGLIEPAFKVVDEASKEAQAEIAATTAMLKGPQRSKEPLVRAELAEVRTRLSAMQPETRNKIIDEAIASGDDARKAIGKALPTPKPNNPPRTKTKSRIQNRRTQETKT